MSMSFRHICAYISIIAGVFLILGHVLNLGGNAEFGTVAGASLVFAAHLLFVFPFAGIYCVQDKRNGVFGLLGMLMGVIGTIASAAVVYVEISGASGNNVEFVYASGIPKIIHSILPLLFVVGLILVAISIIKAKILPRTSGYFLIIGTLVFVLATFMGSLGPIGEALGALFTGLGFMLTGIPLVIGRHLAVEEEATGF